MATLAHTPPAKKADKGLAAQFKRTAAGHMKEIVQKTQDNVELQLLVIDTIRKYEGDLACSSGGTLGEAIKVRRQTNKAVKQENDDNDEKGDFEYMFKGAAPLQRGRFLFRSWGITMYRDLFRFCFPWFTKDLATKVTDAERYREMIEYQWDIRCSSGHKELDKIPTPDKRLLFERMRGEVRTSSDMLSRLAGQLEGGYIDWAKEGHYSFTVGADGGKMHVTVTARKLNRTVSIPDDLVTADASWTSARLMSNHSLHLAYLKTDEDTYILKALFPHMCKQLKRRNSDASKITSAFPGKEEPPVKVTKGPPDTGGSTSGMEFMGVAAPMAMPVMPPSPSYDDTKASGGVKEEG